MEPKIRQAGLLYTPVCFSVPPLGSSLLSISISGIFVDVYIFLKADTKNMKIMETCTFYTLEHLLWKRKEGSRIKKSVFLLNGEQRPQHMNINYFGRRKFGANLVNLLISLDLKKGHRDIFCKCSWGSSLSFFLFFLKDFIFT